MQYLPSLDTYYEHQDGGLYFVLEHALSTVDQSVQIVYKHVFPFEAKIWVRPASEWTTDRFFEVDRNYVEASRYADPIRAQQLVTEAKARRRAKVEAVCEWCRGTQLVFDNTNHTYECACVK